MRARSGKLALQVGHLFSIGSDATGRALTCVHLRQSALGQPALAILGQRLIEG